MSLIGVRDLRQNASEVIRQVRENHAEYVVTYQRRPVAIILPLNEERAEADMVQAGKGAILDSWERYERIAGEIRAAWRTDLSTQDLIDDIRR